jgi:transposase-like protein
VEKIKRTKYTPEFKEVAVKQVIDRGYAVPDVFKRLGIAEGVLYTWVSKFKKADEHESNDLKAMVILPFCKGVRSRNVTQPWPIAA